jgi:hypothetical protein
MSESESSIFNEQSAKAPSTLGGRLLNIFVSPTEVFDELKASAPRAMNWIVPLSIAIVAGIIYTLVIYSQPQVMQTFRDAMEKPIQKQVDSGKLTQQKADQQIALLEKFVNPGYFKAIGILAVVFGAASALCVTGLFVWLVGGLAFHGGFDYPKALEVTGIALMIKMLGTLISACLGVIFASLYANPGPALFISHFDPSKTSHQLLLALNVMTFWYLAVLSIGISRVSGASFIKSAVCIFGAWAMLTLLQLLPSLLFGGK